MGFLTKRNKYKDALLILTGTFLMSISVNLIYDPMELVTGGVTGIAIIIKHLSDNLFEEGIPSWLTNLVINIPLFLISFRILGLRYVAKTLFATICFTLFLYLIPVAAMFETDLLLASVFGGIFTGVGIGLVFITMATTGGTDMLGMLVHKKRPYYSVPQLLLIIDGAVVALGAAIFGLTRALYAIIAVYICAKISDGLLDGMKFAKSIFIISDSYEEISSEILEKLNRGVTGLAAKGMYSNKDKRILFCVAPKKEMVTILDIVYRIDHSAFVTINDVREVVGEGFVKYEK